MIVKERGEECVRREMVVTGSEGEKGKVAVSYTHLTLPTRR